MAKKLSTQRLVSIYQIHVNLSLHIGLILHNIRYVLDYYQVYLIRYILIFIMLPQYLWIILSIPFYFQQCQGMCFTVNYYAVITQKQRQSATNNLSYKQFQSFL